MDKVRFGGRPFKHSVKVDGGVVSAYSLVLCLKVFLKLYHSVTPWWYSWAYSVVQKSNCFLHSGNGFCLKHLRETQNILFCYSG